VRAPPAVSVIVPFLDEERFLGDAIESVVAQTRDDWELLLVDDGSSDGSREIARTYAKQHPDRIFYLQHDGGTNRGMSASRNLGLGCARGRFLAFLDADDTWKKRKLEDQVELLESEPEAVLVWSPAEWWYSWTGSPEDEGRDAVWWPFDEEGLFPGTRAIASLILAPSANTTPSLVRAQAARSAGGFEEGFRGMHEDQAFFVKVTLGAQVLATGSCWYRWRQHPDSYCAVSIRDGAWLWQRRRFFSWVAYTLRQAAVTDRYLWRVLEEEWTKVEDQLPGESRVGVPRRLRTRLLTPFARTRRTPVEPLSAPARTVELGDLRRTEPVSRDWGYARGTPVDRYYIERFLGQHASDVQGRVLEVADDEYAHRFGGRRVALTDILNAREHPRATIVADLASAPHVPSDTYDCIILTQTLQYVFDVRAGIETLLRILKPGAVLLVTVPGITQTGDPDLGDSWYWSFTSPSARRLFGEVFGDATVEVTGYGNVLAAVAFLEGLAAEELRAEELDEHDPAYEVTIAVRAVKPLRPTVHD